VEKKYEVRVSPLDILLNLCIPSQKKCVLCKQLKRRQKFIWEMRTSGFSGMEPLHSIAKKNVFFASEDNVSLGNENHSCERTQKHCQI